ncbi:hypothetical protein [Nocardioides sp. Kera G14]|uniref:hypothetical protein n=1 Tax=Nocardioides sp. Kera G14 TaxID=2884264 RepID=UPI001D123A30|nr:hypothetical protein [Nocardioides sp. Kera G14]UDY24818.1 hypothetical protein LH076_05830 [Nocardioides sp. Kera G14]
MPLALSELTAADVLSRAEWAVQDRRSVAVEEFDLALRWADLHSIEPEISVPGGDRMITLGGDGTPPVRDLCLEELAVARGEHVFATRSLLADVLDLRHRLPGLWLATKLLQVEPWVARKIASMSRKLGVISVAYLDVVLAQAVDLPNGKLLQLAEAEIIKADQALRVAELEAAKQTKGVWLARRDDEAGAGLREIFARLEAADAIWFDATCQRVADILKADPDLRKQHHPELGENPSMDELRAAAFGWLARPYDLAELLGLLDEHEQDTDDADEAEATKPARRHKAVLFLHLHQAALEGAGGVARSSDLGPLLLQQVAQLLGHSDVIVKPVIDLNTGTHISAYEHPATVKERTMLRTTGPVFPHNSGSEASRVDHDHATPYVPPDAGGPPGQTGDHNDAPLSRHSHRAKTHLNYQVEQLGPDAYLWTTPHGLIRLVNNRGTHKITEEHLDLIRRIYGA